MSTTVHRAPTSLVDGLDPGILNAQQAANGELLKMPHPDPRTPKASWSSER